MSIVTQGFTIQRLGKIRNRWVRDAISETLCTFILTLFVFCSGAQAVLTHGSQSSVTARGLAIGVGLMVAVYSGMKASGAAVNPNVAIMFCLLGKMPWKKLPMYIVAELIGAFSGAAVTYILHRDLIIVYEEAQAVMNGTMTTATLFTSLPDVSVSKTTAFFDIVVGTAVLDACIAAITDPFNSGPHTGLIPFIFAIMLPGILIAFSANLGCLINSGADLGGRVFAGMVYGPHVFTYWNYWFWIPLIAGALGSIIGSFFYQLGIGNHLIPQEDMTKGNYTSVERLEDVEA